MALADSYKRPCPACERSVSMAYQYCPWCSRRLTRWRTALELIEGESEDGRDVPDGRGYAGP